MEDPRPPSLVTVANPAFRPSSRRAVSLPGVSDEITAWGLDLTQNDTVMEDPRPSSLVTVVNPAFRPSSRRKVSLPDVSDEITTDAQGVEWQHSRGEGAFTTPTPIVTKPPGKTAAARTRIWKYLLIAATVVVAVGIAVAIAVLLGDDGDDRGGAGVNDPSTTLLQGASTASRDPTAVLSVSPSASPSETPTASPSHRPAVIIGIVGTPTVLPAGPVRLAASGEHQLLRMTATSLATNRSLLVGRAYGGHRWESAPPEMLHFACEGVGDRAVQLYRTAAAAASSTAPICTAVIPSGDATRYEIEAFDLERLAPDARSRAARFMMRATFGPTRAAIEAFLTEHNGDARAWIEAQIAVPATLHRAFFRQRVNPRVPEASHLPAGGVRPVCTGSSRWNRFAFTDDDVGKVIDVAPAGAGRLNMSIHGGIRSVVDSAALDYAVFDPPEANRTYSSKQNPSHSSMIDANGWTPSQEDLNAYTATGDVWMQIDLGVELSVSGVLTRGNTAEYGAENHFAHNFTVMTSIDGTTFTTVSNLADGTTSFDNSHNRTTTGTFSTPVIARHVRFNPTYWRRSAYLRAALIVDASVPTLGPYTICEVQEWVGGKISVGLGCSVLLENPAVQFATGYTPETDRIVATVLSGAELTLLAWHGDASRDDDSVLLPSQGVDWRCELSTPAAGSLFAMIEDTGAYLVHDRRLSLVGNTLEHPADGASLSSSGGRCATVPKTFLNAHSCVTGTETCAATRYSSAILTLDEAVIRQFFLRGGKFVYHVTGLRLEGTASPCSGTSRWMRRSSSDDEATCADQLDAVTRATIAAAIDSSRTHNNDWIRDILLDDGSTTCSAAAGAFVQVGGECWQHVHSHEGDVRDFSEWALRHSGNAAALARDDPPPIQKWAWRGSTALYFPTSHPIERFTTAIQSHVNAMGLLGRLGDTVDFVDLPTTVQVEPMAQLFGADAVAASFGDETCGSPGEVPNVPVLTNQLKIGLGTYEESRAQIPDRNSRDEIPQEHSQYVTWSNVALSAPDQLRQRVAWSLSQILVINKDGAMIFDAESYITFYDIFVRHAFGSFRDIMKEVSYSSVMGKMLSFINSKSIGSSGFYPDENYAREIMQLFTMGLWQLHDNGTRVTGTDGQGLPTYSQDDIVNFARGWTGFTHQLQRGNIEYDVTGSLNNIDPMRMIMSQRDMWPKTDLTGGYIGDGLQLCVDLPSKHFLRRGGTYQYLGPSALPRKSFLPPAFADLTNRYNAWLELHNTESSLYRALCQPNTTTGVDGHCQFTSDVTLTEALPCHGTECLVDTAEVVMLRGAGRRSNGETYDVFFEYIRPPCVELSYFDDPVMAIPRFGLRYGHTGNWFHGRPMCANPRAPMALTGCCPDVSNSSHSAGFCVHEYSDERVTLATAEARCAVYGQKNWTACAKEGGNCQCYQGEARYGYEDLYSSNWSNPVSQEAWSTVCTAASYGNHSLPVGVAPICQCRRDDDVQYRLCDLTSPDARVEGNRQPMCSVDSHVWSQPQACQMQAQVSRNGLISMTDHFSGPTRPIEGIASQSSTHFSEWFSAAFANDGKSWTISHTDATTESHPWLQIQFNQPSTIATITVQNRAGGCAQRLFQTTSCALEYPPYPSGDIGGFEVGVSNTSCNDQGCPGVPCALITTPNEDGEGHVYVINCENPVEAHYVYILLPGDNRILHVAELEARGIDHPTAERMNETEFKVDSKERFRVLWEAGRFPQVDTDACSGVCAVHGRTCLCNVTVTEEAVFVDNSTIPSWSQLASTLRIGAPDPALFDNGTYVQCTAQICLDQPNVTVYWRNASGQQLFTSSTIFAIPDGTSADAPLTFRKNVRSMVRIDDGGQFSFRNPPGFSTRGFEKDVRDGEYEVDAMLDHYFNHPTTPPFVAKALLQRLVTSNPSARYVEAVTTAFKTGRHRGIGNGTRGDLAATTAAIYLDREAQSYLLDNDPTAGGFREPLVKMLHVLRALELQTPPDAKLINLRIDLGIGQFPYRAQTVFSFFQHDFQPDGAVTEASLVAPEALALAAPNIIAFLNAAFTTIELGLTRCYGGIVRGTIRDRSISCRYLNPDAHNYSHSFGQLTYQPGDGGGALLLNPPEEFRTYSSVWDDDPTGTAHATSMIGSGLGWASGVFRIGEWMEIDLGSPHEVLGVVTQARAYTASSGDPQLVNQYEVHYSLDGVSYENAIGAGGWSPCASERQTCTCNGLVRFGLNTTWTDRIDARVNGSIECTNVVFGDPLPHIAKRCECCEIAGDCGPDTLAGSVTTVNGSSREFFPQAVIARWIKFVVLDWSRHAIMRAGVLVSSHPADAPVREQNFAHFQANYTNAAEVVEELNVLLTGGRLSDHSQAKIEAAFNETVDTQAVYSAAMRVAQRLVVASPEFQLRGGNPMPADPLPLTVPHRLSSSTARRPYKAIVYLFLDGGADSFNMLVPYDGCTGTDMYAQYATERGEIAIPKGSLLPVIAASISRNSSQVCTRFGLHPDTPALQRLYNDGDALFFANAGPLDEPVTKAEYDAKTKRLPSQLFAHNTQSHLAQNLDARMATRVDGVVGRMMDALSTDGVQTGSYSIAGGQGATVLEPVISSRFDVLSGWGVSKLEAKYGTMLPHLKDLNSRVSHSPFATTWSSRVTTTLNRTDVLGDALDSVTPNTTFAAQSTHLGKQFLQIAKLMKANEEVFHNEREAFYVHLGGFDVHANAIDAMQDLMQQVDGALGSFEAEMKSQGRWDQVTIVEVSEFGRTVTSNGDGSDHAWGGNYFMAGGAVKGGQIIGKFPADLTDNGVENLGRGRLLPTTSWEHIWNAVGDWFGVDETDMDTVLPRRSNFPDRYTAEDVFE